MTSFAVIWLLAAHFVADFVFQTTKTGLNKSTNNRGDGLLFDYSIGHTGLTTSTKLALAAFISVLHEEGSII